MSQFPFLLLFAVIFLLLGFALLAGWFRGRRQRAAHRRQIDLYRSQTAQPDPGDDEDGFPRPRTEWVDNPGEAPATLALRAPVIPLTLGFVLFAACILTIVPTRQIGVVTSFGRPIDSYGNGIHLKEPWTKVKKLDGTIQTDSRTGSDERPTGSDGTDGEPQSCTDIRIGNGSTACVDNSVRWRIKLDAGQRLYQDYPAGMDAIRDSLVGRQLKASLNEVLGDYNPLDVIKDNTGDVRVAPDLAQFQEDVKAALDKRVGSDIEILDVLIPIVRLDKSTQTKINDFQREVANTRIAEQSVETARQQAEANNRLRQSVENTPEVLQSRCLDIFAEMVKAGQTVPPGFSCIGTGSQVGILAQTK